MPRLGTFLILLFSFAGAVFAAETETDKKDSVIRGNILPFPSNYRDKPIGFREKPLTYLELPIGYREHPLGFVDKPNGFREKPLSYVDEPDVKLTPPNFIEKDSHPQADNNPLNKITQSEHPAANNDISKAPSKA